MDYGTYISSPSWGRRRLFYFARHKKRCNACGTTKSIHLHHLTYERMGQELDQDLMALCEMCHDTVHHVYRTDRRDQSLKKVTNRVVDQIRQKRAKRAQEQAPIQAIRLERELDLKRRSETRIVHRSEERAQARTSVRRRSDSKVGTTGEASLRDALLTDSLKSLSTTDLKRLFEATTKKPPTPVMGRGAMIARIVAGQTRLARIGSSKKLD